MFDRELERIFRDLELWVKDHPLSALVIALVAWGLWWRRSCK